MLRFLSILSCLLLAQAMLAGDYKGNASVGLISSGGNTETTTAELKSTNEYTLDEASSVTFGGHYTYGKALDLTSATEEQILNARNWDVNARYNRKLNERWGYFLGHQVEGDQFANIDERYNTDLGASYQAIKNDKTDFRMEAGLRHTVERYYDDITPTQNFMKARLFGIVAHKFSETVTGGFWAEYIPNFDESEDWNFNFEPSLSVQLSNMFSLKMAFLGQYDNLPIGAARDKKFDYQYTTYLVANF